MWAWGENNACMVKRLHGCWKRSNKERNWVDRWILLNDSKKQEVKSVLCMPSFPPSLSNYLNIQLHSHVTIFFSSKGYMRKSFFLFFIYWEMDWRHRGNMLLISNSKKTFDQLSVTRFTHFCNHVTSIVISRLSLCLLRSDLINNRLDDEPLKPEPSTQRQTLASMLAIIRHQGHWSQSLSHCGFAALSVWNRV